LGPCIHHWHLWLVAWIRRLADDILPPPLQHLGGSHHFLAGFFQAARLLQETATLIHAALPLSILCHPLKLPAMQVTECTQPCLIPVIAFDFNFTCRSP